MLQNLIYDHKKTTQYNVNSLTLGNQGHWFVKQELFEQRDGSSFLITMG